MIVGLVLAGGRSSRFGADKALAALAGHSLVEAVIACLANGCASVALSARGQGPLAEFATARGLERLDDPSGAAAGPLSGVLAGLGWARGRGADLLATAPCDTPFLPADLVARLAAALAEGDGAAVARTSEGLQPLCAIWRTDRIEALAEALAGGAHPPVREALHRLGARPVDFPDPAAFFNVNTRADLTQAAARAGRGARAD